jgi:hypothetical protein
MKHADCGGTLKPSKRRHNAMFWYRCDRCKKYVSIGSRRVHAIVRG